MAAYQRAIALAPDFREAWLNLAQARKEARGPAARARRLACAGSVRGIPAQSSLRLIFPSTFKTWKAHGQQVGGVPLV